MVEERRCLRCGVDLSEVMGVMVFVPAPWPDQVRRVPGLLCVEHGKNGANTLRQAEYDRLVAERRSDGPGRGVEAGA